MIEILTAEKPIKGYNNSKFINSVKSIIDNDPVFMVAYLKKHETRVKLPLYLEKKLIANIEKYHKSDEFYIKRNAIAYIQIEKTEKNQLNFIRTHNKNCCANKIKEIDDRIKFYKKNAFSNNSTTILQNLDKASYLIGLLKSSITIQYQYQTLNDSISIHQVNAYQKEHYLEAVKSYKRMTLYFIDVLKNNFKLTF